MEKEILGIQLERLRVPAVREFLHSVDEAIENCTTVKTQMPQVYQPWKAAFAEMNRVYEISLKSEDTALIHNLDDRRDNLHTSVMAAANNYRKAMDDETRRKGMAVWNAMNSFKVNIGAQYNIQTAQLDSLLGVLLSEPLQADVEALGLLPLVTELKSLNDRLHELVGIRDLENINKPDGQRQEAMAAAIAAYRRLVKFVNAYYVINVEAAGTPDDGLSLFMDLVNSIILRYRRNFSNAGAGSEGAGGADGSEGGADGEGGNGAGGEQQEEEDDGKRTVTFTFANGETEKVTGEPGEPLTYPTNTAGYIWSTSDSNPSKIPERNFYIIEVPENVPLFTIVWFIDATTPIQWYQLPVGHEVPAAPAPPAGDPWSVTVSVMPDHNLYILPESLAEEEEE